MSPSLRILIELGFSEAEARVFMARWLDAKCDQITLDSHT